MKKSALLFTAFLLCCGSAWSQKINYEKSLEQAEKLARQNNKILCLLVIAPPPPGIGPIPILQGLRDPAIVSKLNEHFVNYRVYRSDSASSPIVKKYKLTSYPAFIFVDKQGGMIFKKIGNMPSTILFTMLDEAIEESKRKSIIDYEQQYSAGERSRTFLKEYINKRIKADITDNASLIEEYVNTMLISELNNYNEVLFILKAGPIADGRVFTFINTNRKLVDSIFKTELFNVRLAINNRIIENTMASAIATKNINQAYAASNHTRTSWNNTNRAQGQKNANLKLLQYYIGIKDTITFLRFAVDHFNRNYMRLSLDSIRKLDARNAEIAQNNAHEQAILSMLPLSGSSNTFYSYGASTFARELNIGAYSVYLTHTKDPSILTHAVSWSRRSVELSPNSANHDTLAHLLYRLGKYGEAETTQQKAVELGKAEKRNIRNLQEDLARIKKRTL